MSKQWRNDQRYARQEATASLKIWLPWLIGVLIVLSILGGVMNFIGVGTSAVQESVANTFDADNIRQQYEQFYNRNARINALKLKIVASRERVNANLATLPEESGTWTVAQSNRHNQLVDGLFILETNLMDAVEEYNAKAKQAHIDVFNGTGCQRVTLSVEVTCEALESNFAATTVDGILNGQR